MPKMKLLEAFKDFKVMVKSDKRYREVVLIKDLKKVKAKDLKSLVDGLRRKYPDKNYRLEKKGKYYIIRRGNDYYNNIPVYFDLKAGKVLIPSSYYKRKKRLVCSVILYRLNPLKLVKVI